MFGDCSFGRTLGNPADYQVDILYRVDNVFPTAAMHFLVLISDTIHRLTLRFERVIAGKGVAAPKRPDDVTNTTASVIGIRRSRSNIRTKACSILPGPAMHPDKSAQSLEHPGSQ